MATKQKQKRNNSHLLHGIYAVTPYDPQHPLSTGALIEQLRLALSAGVRIIQYRNKFSDAGVQREQAGAIKALCEEYQALFIVNDNVSLARSVNAHGVHIGVDDMALTQARAELGENAIIGVSCYNRLDLAQQAEQGGADYVAFGRFFPSKTKPAAVHAPLELVSQAKQHLRVPLACIGGIRVENAKLLISAGADMLAVIDGIFGQPDVSKAAAALVNIKEWLI